MDTLTPEQRSERMARVRGKDTRPEMAIRRALHALGYRYRLHDKQLPGKPDLVFPKRRKLVFVHGCFWHRHVGCPLARLPKSRQDFWVPKLDANRQRDARHLAELRALGWQVMVVWECELKDIERATKRLARFLEDKDRDGDASC